MKKNKIKEEIGLSDHKKLTPFAKPVTIGLIIFGIFVLFFSIMAREQGFSKDSQSPVETVVQINLDKPSYDSESVNSPSEITGHQGIPGQRHRIKS